MTLSHVPPAKGPAVPIQRELLPLNSAPGSASSGACPLQLSKNHFLSVVFLNYIPGLKSFIGTSTQQ